jgi:hypothetical protein
MNGQSQIHRCVRNSKFAVKGVVASTITLICGCSEPQLYGMDVYFRSACQDLISVTVQPYCPYGWEYEQSASYVQLRVISLRPIYSKST